MWLSFNDDEVVDDYNGDYSRFKSLKQTIIKIITMISFMIKLVIIKSNKPLTFIGNQIIHQMDS